MGSGEAQAASALPRERTAAAASSEVERDESSGGMVADRQSESEAGVSEATDASDLASHGAHALPPARVLVPACWGLWHGHACVLVPEWVLTCGDSGRAHGA